MDENVRNVLGGVTNDASLETRMLRVDPTTNRLLVDALSELPTAAVLADNTANPTAPAVGSFNHIWDGATWDRLPGNSTDGALVNLGSNNDVSLNAGTNAIGKLAANSGVDIGDVDILSIAAGANLIGDVGISGARTSGGVTPYKNIDVDETEDEVKGTAGQVYFIHAINKTATPLYLKFYNATAANVTVGSTVPVHTFPVPANADSDGAGFTLAIPNGIAFSAAITIAGTTGVADNDTGAPGANDLVVNLGYA